MQTSNKRVVAATIFGLICTAAAGVSAMEVDCSEQLELIPRSQATVQTTNLWLSYSGAINYAELGDASQGEWSASEEPLDVVSMRAESHLALEVEVDEPDSYQWQIGQGPQGSFTVSDDASRDEQAPTIGEGEVEVDVELLVSEEFPVIFRDWTLRFPAAEDGQTSPENMRYLLEFSWVDDHEGDESKAVLVTPSVDDIGDEEVTVRLGGRTDRCRHQEPQAGLTEEVEIHVRAVDLAGNISDEAVTGLFKGATAEEFADAHDELQRVIELLRQRSIEEREQRRAEEAAAEEQEEESAGRCSIVAGGGTAPVAALVALGLFGLIRRIQRRRDS